MQLRRKFSRRAASVPAVARNDIHRSGDRRESVQGLAPTAIKSTQPIRLRPLDSSVFASLLTFAGVSAAILFASTYRTAIPAIAIPASLLAAAVLAALVSAYARPLPLRQVAMTLDLRLDLRERLSTALELMGGQGNRRRRGQTPVSPIRVRTRTRSASVPLAAPALAEVIFVQAVSRSRQAGVDQLRFHAVGRPALGAMGLSLLLAAAMLALPGGEPKTFDSADDILAVFPNLPENRRVDLAQELARAAAGAQTRQQQQSLNQAADAASRNDLESLREALDRIKEGIAKGLLKIVRVGPAPGERLADDTSPPHAIANPHAANTAAAANTSAPIVSPSQMELVYNRKYDRFAGDNNAAPNDSRPQQGGTYVPFDTAWRQAVAAANQSLRTGHVPPRCQQLVADFFKANNAPND